MKTTPKKNKRNCLFCNSILSNRRSQEHIFPQWLLDNLKIRKVLISPTHFSAKDRTVVSSREHELQNLKEGRICNSCNNGWMSDMESAARPILLNLIEGNHEVAQLSCHERGVIAKWATKTAYVLNSASNYYSIIPKHQYNELKNGSSILPNHVAVFGCQHNNTERFYWLQQTHWSVIAGKAVNPNKLKKLAIKTYKISLQFGKLLLLVTYWPYAGWQLALQIGVHVPLWPQSGPVCYYEQEIEFPWNDSLKAIAAFHYGLNLVHTGNT